MFQEDNDEVYLEPTDGKLHQTSEELALTVDRENWISAVS